MDGKDGSDVSGTESDVLPPSPNCLTERIENANCTDRFLSGVVAKWQVASANPTSYNVNAFFRAMDEHSTIPIDKEQLKHLTNQVVACLSELHDASTVELAWKSLWHSVFSSNRSLMLSRCVDAWLVLARNETRFKCACFILDRYIEKLSTRCYDPLAAQSRLRLAAIVVLVLATSVGGSVQNPVDLLRSVGQRVEKNHFSADKVCVDSTLLAIQYSQRKFAIGQYATALSLWSCLVHSYMDSSMFHNAEFVGAFVTASEKAFSAEAESTSPRLIELFFSFWTELIRLLPNFTDFVNQEALIFHLVKAVDRVFVDSEHLRRLKLQCWWTILKYARDQLECHFGIACAPLLNFSHDVYRHHCNEAFLIEVLANFLLPHPDGYFDIPHLAPLAVPCFSKPNTVVQHLPVLLKSLAAILPKVKSSTDLASSCWFAIFTSVHNARARVTSHQFMDMCDMCCFYYAKFLRRSPWSCEQILGLLSLVAPHVNRFPVQTKSAEDGRLCDSHFPAFHLCRMFLERLVVSDSDCFIWKTTGKEWFRATVQSLLESIVPDDFAPVWLDNFYKTDLAYLTKAPPEAFAIAWRCFVAYLMTNLQLLNRSYITYLSSWLLVSIRWPPVDRDQLQSTLENWRLLVNAIPESCFADLCRATVEEAGQILTENVGHSANRLTSCLVLISDLLTIASSRRCARVDNHFLFSNDVRQGFSADCLKFYLQTVQLFLTTITNVDVGAFDYFHSFAMRQIFCVFKIALSTVRRPEEAAFVLERSSVAVDKVLKRIVDDKRASTPDGHKRYWNYIEAGLNASSPFVTDCSVVAACSPLLETILNHSSAALRLVGVEFIRQNVSEDGLKKWPLPVRESFLRAKNPRDSDTPEIIATSLDSNSSPARLVHSTSSTGKATVLNKSPIVCIGKDPNGQRAGKIGDRSRLNDLQVRRKLRTFNSRPKDTPVFVAATTHRKLPMITRVGHSSASESADTSSTLTLNYNDPSSPKRLAANAQALQLDVSERSTSTSADMEDQQILEEAETPRTQLMPQMSNWSVPIEQLAPHLTSSTCCPALVKMLRERGITTVGQFAALSPCMVNTLPIREPNVSVALTALNGLLKATNPTGRPDVAGHLLVSLKENINRAYAMLHSSGAFERPAELLEVAGLLQSSASALVERAKDLVSN